MALPQRDWDSAQKTLVADIVVLGGSYAHAVKALKGEFGIVRTRNAVTGIANRTGGREQFVARFRSTVPNPDLRKYIPTVSRKARPMFFGRPQRPPKRETAGPKNQGAGGPQF